MTISWSIAGDNLVCFCITVSPSLTRISRHQQKNNTLAAFKKNAGYVWKNGNPNTLLLIYDWVIVYFYTDILYSLFKCTDCILSVFFFFALIIIELNWTSNIMYVCRGSTSSREKLINFARFWRKGPVQVYFLHRFWYIFYSVVYGFGLLTLLIDIDY